MAERDTRRRRDPRLAEREILDAARAFLAERPFRELTVDTLMARTGLSRPSFYVYFQGRHNLMARLLEDIGRTLFEIDQEWLAGDDDSVATLTTTLREVTRYFAEHGPLLRAVADAASADAEVERLYRFTLIAGLVIAVEGRIGRGQAAGAITVDLDPAQVGLALVLMMERYLLDTVARSPGMDAEPVVAALVAIWDRTLHGRP